MRCCSRNRSIAARQASGFIDVPFETAGDSLVLCADDGPRLVPGLLHKLDLAGVEVRSVEVARPTLDDVFLALTGRSLREGVSTTEEFAA